MSPQKIPERARMKKRLIIAWLIGMSVFFGGLAIAFALAGPAKDTSLFQSIGMIPLLIITIIPLAALVTAPIMAVLIAIVHRFYKAIDRRPLAACAWVLGGIWLALTLFLIVGEASVEKALSRLTLSIWFILLPLPAVIAFYVMTKRDQKRGLS